jgi:hypothetical protein
MSKTVDAYQKWLDIPPEEQPPSHYRLLGLESFEADRATIDGAAKRLMGALQKQLAGPDQASIRKLLDEISDARRCLLLGDRKTAYDQKLRASLAANQAAETSGAVELAEPIDVPIVEPIDIEPAAPVDVAPIGVAPVDEISAAVPIPDEAVPEAVPMPLEEVESAPEANPIDEPDEAPEAEPFDEIDEPTALEQIDESRSAAPEAAIPSAVIPAAVPPQAVAPPKPAASQPPAIPKPTAPQTTAAQFTAAQFTAAQPAATPPAAPSKPAPPKPAPPKPAPTPQPIAATARPSAPAAVEKPAETVAAADAQGWDHSESAAGDDAIDGSFFSGMGLSSVRTGGAPTSVAADSIAGTGAGEGKTAGKPKNSKPLAAKTNPKNPAGAKSASTATQSEGTSNVKKAAKRGPPMWQIMTAVGGGVVVLILVVAAVTGGGPSTPPSTTRPAAVKSEPLRYGPQTVTGPIDDRTTRSPVTGAPVKVPIERHGDLMVVAVRINDQDAGKFLLDTGVRDIIIGNDIAEKLKLPKLGEKSMNVPGGTQQVIKRKIKSLTMGTVRFDDSLILPPPTGDNWEAVAVDMKPWSDAIHFEIAGVIGCDIWSQTPFEINPSKNVLTFFKRGHFPFSDPQKADFLTLFDHKPAMPATADQTQGTYLLATGAPSGVMVKGSSAPLETLSAFGRTIPNPATVESKDGDGYFDAEVRQSGVIGAGILSHYILDFDFQYQKFLAVPIKE